MTQPDAQPRALAASDTVAEHPMASVDLTGDGVRPGRFRSSRFVSRRRWILGASLMLVLALGATWGFLLTQAGGGTEAAAGSSSQTAAQTRVGSHGAEAAISNSGLHRRSPIRRTSPSSP
jgi:hypothetical protein